MPSTVPSTVQTSHEQHPAQQPLTWRSWPLADHPRWSWLAVAAIIAAGMVGWYVSQSWPFALFAAAGLAITLWHVFMPSYYEISPRGLRLSALGRKRYVSWQAIRSYEPRTSGVVLYRCYNPMKVDLLRSWFLPYPPDAGEVLSRLRQYLQHAVELPQ